VEKYNFILKIKTKDNTGINNKKFPKNTRKSRHKWQQDWFRLYSRTGYRAKNRTLGKDGRRGEREVSGKIQ